MAAESMTDDQLRVAAGAQGWADGEAGIPSRYLEFSAATMARSYYIRGYADAVRARLAAGER